MSSNLFAGPLPALTSLTPDGLVPSGALATGLPVLILLGLGAVHGINPGMGWLFAVALGLQRRQERAVWAALPPLAAGHALAIVTALAVAALLGMVVSLSTLKWVVAGLLVGYGAYRLVRTRHPRYGGMLVGRRELGVWSFLMASAHGAGLMVVPFVLSDGARSAGTAMAGHAAHGGVMAASGAAVGAQGAHTAALAGTAGGVGTALAASVIHSLGYLIVTALVAAVVYRWLGLRLLRTHWVNLDLIWSVALILTGLVTPWL